MDDTILKIVNDIDSKLIKGYQFCDRCNALFKPTYRNHPCMYVIIKDPYEGTMDRYFWEYLCDDCLPLSR